MIITVTPIVAVARNRTTSMSTGDHHETERVGEQRHRPQDEELLKGARDTVMRRRRAVSRLPALVICTAYGSDREIRNASRIDMGSGRGRTPAATEARYDPAQTAPSRGTSGQYQYTHRGDDEGDAGGLYPAAWRCHPRLGDR
jgi:hypothetical protein